jgi:hypothetical protein
MELFPNGAVSVVTFSLREPLLAFPFIETGNKNTRSEIPAGATIELCGGGFDEHTVKVRVGGYTHFIFIDDIAPRVMSASGSVPSLVA